MKHTLVALTVTSLGLALSVASYAAPKDVKAGLYEFTVKTEGGPRTLDPITEKVCVNKKKLAGGVEKAFAESAPRRPWRGGPGGASGARPEGKDSGKDMPKMAGKDAPRLPPSCTTSDLQNSGDRSTWKTTCESPRGSVVSTSSGKFFSERVEIESTSEINSPNGPFTVRRLITAARVGDC